MDLDNSQTKFIADTIQKVRQAQYEALKAVNTHLISLYWELGKDISEKQKLGWGKAIVLTLFKELQKEFPAMTGFSVGNLWLMAQFYADYQNDTNLVPLVREISWTKHTVILKKCKDPQERLFYTIATKKFGWKKQIVIHQIENNTYQNYLLNQTDFDDVLTDKIKNQAYLAVKDHYNFGFLEMGNEHGEYELEQALINGTKNYVSQVIGAKGGQIGISSSRAIR